MCCGIKVYYKKLFYITWGLYAIMTSNPQNNESLYRIWKEVLQKQPFIIIFSA